MTKLGKISRLAGVAAFAGALIASQGTAMASEDGHNTLLGAGAGAVAGGLITHGSPVGIVGGAVVGGLAGHALSHHHHHYHHCWYHHHRRWC